MQESTQPWLSIVTVVKDDAGGFARTAASLSGQDIDGVEWVVIDSSGDRAQIPGLMDQVALSDPIYRWTTPGGVYPAMNAGLEEASGRYCYFLNAGDCLSDDGVLAHVRSVIERDRPVWMYGQVCFVSPDGQRVTPPAFDYEAESRAHFSRGRFPPHQGTVASTPALRSMGGFDVSYRIAADYAAFLRLSRLAPPAETTRTLADFYVGGVSTTHWKASLVEFHRARREILHLSGGAAIRESLGTGAQFLRMQAARWLRRDGTTEGR